MNPGFKILFVDDSDFNHSFLEQILEIKNYPFLLDQRFSPVNAIKLIKRKSYDCIITDFNMPDLNGVEFLHVLESFETRIPPIIGFTGEKNPQEVFRNHQLLLKVFSKDQVSECLDFIYTQIYQKRVSQ